jgi:hypothetical protein
MADPISFFEDLNELIIGLEISDPIAKELTIFARNLINTKDVFKTKITGLINNLKDRNLTDEQIISVLLDDFDSRGEIFGGLERGLLRSSEDLMQNIGNEVEKQTWIEEGFDVDEKETWICVLVNTCEDCFPRHGVTLPHSIWVQRGLPGTGWSVCKEHCQCKTFPASIVESKKELQKPIKRVRGTIRQIAREKKKKGQIKNINKYVNRKLRNINNTQDPIRSQYRKKLPGFKR